MFSVEIGGHRGTGRTDGGFARQQGNHLTRQPENTIESFMDAFASGADSLETDLIRTKDNHLVLIHSTEYGQHIFPPNSRIVGKPFIDQLTLPEVKKLIVGPPGPKGFDRIPTFQSLLRHIEPLYYKGMLLNAELKDVQGTECPRREPQVAALALQEMKAVQFPLEPVRFSSFSLKLLADMRGREPKARIGMLFDAPNDKGGSVGTPLFKDEMEVYRGFTPKAVDEACRRIPDLEAVHPEIQTVNEPMVKLVAERKLKMATWGNNEKSPLADCDFASAARQAVELCGKYGVPLTLITDHVVDMRKFVNSLKL